MPQSVPPHHYARRLQRLLTLINEIKTTPHQAPETLYNSLGISRPMFYKDRQVLKALGLAFHYDRQQRRYIITQDRYLPVLNLSTSEMLALIMAVRQIASTADHTLTYEAIAALHKVVSNTPAESIPSSGPLTLPPLFDAPPTGSSTDWSRSYHGLSTQPFPSEAADILLAPINPLDIEMKPGASFFKLSCLPLPLI